MFPITLSRGLEIVVEITHKGRKRPHWYDKPISYLIQHLGDIPVADVTTDDVIAWYDWIKQKENDRKPGQVISPWTVDSYARSVKSYFNHLVTAGHIETSPARRLRLPRLPPKGKKEISDSDIALMIQHSEMSPRDHAIVLVLRDSGCRVGELISIQVSGLKIVENEGRLHGRAVISDNKTMKSRFIFFNHEASLAVKRYIRVRHHDAPEALWLTITGRAISDNGVYQILKRIGKRAGVEHFNPHAFRHALAKRLVNNGTPHRIIQDILGHTDITTTLSMYVNYDDEELARHHSHFTGYY